VTARTRPRKVATPEPFDSRRKCALDDSYDDSLEGFEVGPKARPWHVECSSGRVRNTSSSSPLTTVASLAALTLFASLAACSGGGADVEAGDDFDTAAHSSALLPSDTSGCDADAHAGRGWLSTSMPASSGLFSVTFRVTPALTEGAWPPVIDAVVGFSDGEAAAFADLGPAVRFNDNGTIDARDGDAYRADESLPYTVHDGPYEVRIDVDVAAHTYSVWARHLDGLAKPMTAIATAYAFRSEQQGVTRLDTFNRYVDGAAGSVTTCAFAYQAITTTKPAAPPSLSATALVRHPMRRPVIDSARYFVR